MTIEGSIPISELPTLTYEQNNYMFAIKLPDGNYVSKDGPPCMSYESDKIKWYKHYLEAEERITGTRMTAVDAVDVMKEAIALKDVTIRQLRDEVDRMTVTHPMHQEFWKQSPELANVEHANETDSP